MIMTVNLKRVTKFTGRNGYFNMKALEVMALDHKDSILLTPITSKDRSARCDIEIPVDDIPDLINTLKYFQKMKPHESSISSRPELS